MTDGISTSPHCLYKSNIVDDVIINKTRQNELVKVFCEYKTEFLILFDDFFRSHNSQSFNSSCEAATTSDSSGMASGSSLFLKKPRYSMFPSGPRMGE